MLIAVAGLEPGTAVTTTTVALAATWPGPEPVRVIDADHAGGSSAAEVTGTAGPVVVFVDCGAPQPVSAETPVLSGADVVVVVVRADLAEPKLAGQRIRELTAGSRRRAVVLVGRPRDSERDYLERLRVPVLGWLPWNPRAANAVVRAHSVLRGPLAAAAGGLAAVMAGQLAGATSGSRPTQARAHHAAGGLGWRRNRTRGFNGARVPSVYPLHMPTPQRRGMLRAEIPLPVQMDDSEQAAVILARSAPIPPTSTAAGERSSGALEATSARLADSVAGSGYVVEIGVFGRLRASWRPRNGLCGNGSETGADSGGAGAGGAAAGAMDIVAALSPRSRELLALLATYPDGVSRRQLIADLWGERPPRRPTNTLTTTMARLQAALAAVAGQAAARLIVAEGTGYRLDPQLARVDYHAFAAAVAARRAAADEPARLAACERIVAAVSGVLAAELTGAWAEHARVYARREWLNAVTTLGRSWVHTAPRRSLELLEKAVEIDPHNELVWCDLLRLHAALGEHDAIARTVAVMRRKFADIGEQPSEKTHRLADHLRNATR
ncbi:hypothetical protein GZH49_12105 [Nocardia terpenica]|uniref:AfsR/SARP family transcriptional regulator n=1 Tax=Nocardia terpenica TaxID=455432 RepID=UPI002FE22403